MALRWHTTADPGPAHSTKNTTGPGLPNQTATDSKGRGLMVDERNAPQAGPERVFPLPRPEADPRFTVGLLLDVTQVLARHGYPADQATGHDLANLRQALFGFLYAPATGGGEDS